jgi:hypothetical protein
MFRVPVPPLRLTLTHEKETDTMKTNSKAVREKIRAHILEAVYDGNGDPFPSYEQARDHLRAEFERVADYPRNRQLFPNHADRFHDYLMGIPFHFEYTDHGIAEYLDSLGINPAGKEYPAEKSARLYAYLIHREIA